MPRYRLTITARAHISETWEIDAESEEQARQRFDEQHPSLTFIAEQVIENSEDEREIESVAPIEPEDSHGPAIETIREALHMAHGLVEAVERQAGPGHPREDDYAMTRDRIARAIEAADQLAGRDAEAGDPILCPRCEGDHDAEHNGYGEECGEDARVARARSALRAHARANGADTVGEDDAVDLLADLMHYAEHDGLDFDRMLDTARNHFDQEHG